MMRLLRTAAIAAALLALIATAGVFGASYYYTSQHGQGCASCHEMAIAVNGMQVSAHRGLGCLECHNENLAAKLRHVRVHLLGGGPEIIRLRGADVLEMVPDCQRCHQQEYAAWHAGPHSASYGQIFTNAAQNTRQRLMEDCLRCHGMHFNGSVRELVQPQNAQGPWHLLRPALQDQPAIPCQACHWVHGEGAPEVRPAARISVADEPIHASLGFFDRREGMHFAAAALTIPALHEGARLVNVSPDPRAAVCYQCHAPRQPEAGSEAAAQAWGPQAGSGDDRTPLGVHEGLSCFSCHTGHNQNARASCKTCHPKMSNCGLDVEKMDTTYASASSAHNIHWVRCADCHQHGIPKKTQTKSSQ